MTSVTVLGVTFRRAGKDQWLGGDDLVVSRIDSERWGWWVGLKPSPVPVNVPVATASGESSSMIQAMRDAILSGGNISSSAPTPPVLN